MGKGYLLIYLEILSCLAAMLNFDSTLLEEPNERMDNLVLMMH
jgi:hypothetical protein